jgi:hypothetical protein
VFLVNHDESHVRSQCFLLVLKTEIKIKYLYFLLLSFCHYGSFIAESEIFRKIQLRRKAMKIGIIIKKALQSSFWVENGALLELRLLNLNIDIDRFVHVSWVFW